MEWKNIQIQASGRNKEIQQASLRKKNERTFFIKSSQYLCGEL